MRVDNKGGFTPRGRRLGRGLVALTAMAVLLSATSAQAVILNFQIVPELSSLGFEQYFGQSFTAAGTNGIPYPHFGVGNSGLYLGDVTEIGDYGQPANSNSAQAFGNLQVDVNTGVSLQIQPGAFISYAETYAYWPHRDLGGGTSTLGIPPGANGGVGGLGPEKLAQFGLSVVGFAGVGPDVKFVDFENSDVGYGNIYNFTQSLGRLSTLDTDDPVGSSDGGAPMPFLGGTSYGIGDLTLIGLTGTEDIASTPINIGTGLDGVPTPIGGGFGGFNQPTTDAVATWDGTFLTIPVNNRIVFVDGGTLYDITTFGQLVAVVVPEPSSIAMLACGAIGLVGYVVRRKRKA
jgi:hypothetical protein